MWNKWNIHVGPNWVYSKDIWAPGLAMSWSIGDIFAHKIGVSELPTIKRNSITQNENIRLIIASDGLWEYVPNEDAWDHMNDLSIESSAKSLSELGRSWW